MMSVTAGRWKLDITDSCFSFTRVESQNMNSTGAKSVQKDFGGGQSNLFSFEIVAG